MLFIHKGGKHLYKGYDLKYTQSYSNPISFFERQLSSLSIGLIGPFTPDKAENATSCFSKEQVTASYHKV